MLVPVGLNAVAKTKKPTYNVCTKPGKVTDIGSVEFPIATKYKHLNNLGQFFTAQECGGSRLKLFRSSQTYVDLTLTLKKNPSKGLLSVLKSIGFKSTGKNKNGTEQWSLGFEKKVLIDRLLKLKPYYQQIERDDCLNCG